MRFMMTAAALAFNLSRFADAERCYLAAAKALPTADADLTPRSSPSTCGGCSPSARSPRAPASRPTARTWRTSAPTGRSRSLVTRRCARSFLPGRRDARWGVLIVVVAALAGASPAAAFDSGPHGDLTVDAMRAEGFDQRAARVAWVTSVTPASSARDVH